MRKKQRQNKSGGGAIIVTLIVILILLIAAFLLVPNLVATSYDSTSEIVAQVVESVEQIVEKEKEDVSHVETPDSVKNIYMTACVAGTPSFRQNLVDLTEETEVNSIIIDIKDFSGTISFNLEDEDMIGYDGTGCKASDMKEFVQTLHDKGIYVIGRITVFQDPFYTKARPDLAVKRASDGSVWEDYKGISFIDVGAKEYWDYVIEMAELSHQSGFDEINFDYVRYPSDGNMKDIHFPHSDHLLEEEGKSGSLERFFKYLKEEIDEYNEDQKYPLITSADLFGMVTTNTDDLNIGQVLEKALPYFDYIAPMVYPSHYPPHFNGWVDPNDYPAELIEFVMSSGVERVEVFDTATSTPQDVRDHVSTDQLRPWLQDFDYGGNYDVAEVRGQIDATYRAGLDSWMLWAPSNRYTRGALKGVE